MTLSEYLLEAARLPWRDGSHDCSAWPARWAGIPIPTYSTREAGEALIAEAGGLVPLWERWIADRLERVEVPQLGDVGIIVAIDAERRVVDIGAICTGVRWAFLVPGHGLVSSSADHKAVWRVPCPKP